MADYDYKKQAQDYYSKAPVIILGSGASAAFGLSSMDALADYIIRNVVLDGLSDEEVAVWEQFTKLLAEGVDLESALHKVHLTDKLTSAVVLKTWELINPQDISVFEKSIQCRDLFPLGELLRSMFQSTLKEVDVITTNYDRLAEYACDQENIYHYTGFSHGFIRNVISPGQIITERKVNIWKVHGSLDWFKPEEEPTFGLANTSPIPDDVLPQIITPGNDKYRLTHLEPFRTIISAADNAIQNANSFLCVGFGFNDQHIQEKLVQKCVGEKSCLTLITYSLSDAAKRFLFESKVDNYLAIERGETDEKSVIHSSMLDGSLHVEGNYWSIGGYLNAII